MPVSGDRTVDTQEFAVLFRQLLPQASDYHVDRAFSILDLEKQVGWRKGRG